MKKNLLKRIVSVLLSVMMVLSLMVNVAAVDTPTAVGKASKVYFAERTLYGYSLTEVDSSEYYSYDEATSTYTRASTRSTAEASWYAPYIMLGEYQNFTMEFDITFAPNYNQQWFNLIIGAESKTSYGWENGSGAEIIRIGTGTKFTEESSMVTGSDLFKVYTQSFNEDGTEKHHEWGNNDNSFDGAKAFHTTLRVYGQSIYATFEVDGSVYHTRKGLMNQLYDGGFVGIAASASGAKIANLKICEQTDFSEYAFYGKHTDRKLIYDIDSHYTVEDITVGEGDNAYTTKKYTRNSTSNSSGSGYASMVNFGVHDEFKLSFKYKYSGTAEQYIVIGLGNQIIGDGTLLNGSSNLRLGYATSGKTNNYYDTYDNVANQYTGWGDSSNDAAWLDGGKSNIALDASVEHTVTVSISNNILTYDIDNGYYTHKRSINGLYNGGYVSVGADRSGVYFYDVKIEDLTPPEEGKVFLRGAVGAVTGDPVDASTYYTITTDENGNKTYKRNGTKATTASSGGWQDNVAFLTLGNYKDFRLEFDYDYTDITNYKNNNINECAMWINIGNLRSNGLRYHFGSHGFGIRQSNNDGWIGFSRTETAEDGTTSVVNKTGWMAGYSSANINYRGGSLFSTTEMSGHVVMTVKDGFVIIQRDNSEISFELSDLYVGGYVQIGLNTEGIEYSNITIEEIGKVETPFTAYYTDSLGTYQNASTTSVADLTERALDEDWSWDGNTLSYKLAPSSGAFNKYMSVAYLNTQKYTEFELSFDYRGSRETWNPIFVGFGAELGKSWMTDNCIKAERTYEPDDGNQFLMLRPNGWVTYGPSSGYLAGKTSADQASSWYYDAGTLQLAGTLFDETAEYYAYHNCTIRVENGKAAVYIDGKIQGVMNLIGNYDGGYIYFASNRYGASYRNIKVTDLTDETASYDIDGFTAYHSDKISSDSTLDTGMTQVKASENWSYNAATKTVSRNISANNAESDSEPSKSNWAQLFYNTKLENFEMEVDITDGADMWKRMYIGVGAKNIGEHFMGNDGGFALHSYPDGVSYKKDTDTYIESEDGSIYNQDGQLVNENGAFLNADGSLIKYFGFNLAGRFWNNEGYKYEWRPAQDNTNTYARTYHVRLVVQDRLLSVYVNGSEKPATCWTMPIWYEDNGGGYISFGTTSSCASFANFTVNGVDAFEITENENLNGKSALFVGDSISNGHTDIAMMYAWGGRIGRKYGMEWINESHSGSNLAEKGDGSGQTIAEQLAVHGDRDIDYVIIEGGVNDAMNKLPAGTISNSYDKKDFDTYTFAGALEYAFAYATETWGTNNPDFHIGYLVTFQNRWISREGTAEHYNVARAICQKWNVPYLDLNADSVAMALDIENKTYIPDGIHPNSEGYDLLTENYIEPWLAGDKASGWEGIPAWGGIEDNLRGDVSGDGVIGAGDLSALKQNLLINFYDGFDFSEVDIYGVWRNLTPDLNGDTVVNILDLIRLKKILAGLA